MNKISLEQLFDPACAVKEMTTDEALECCRLLHPLPTSWPNLFVTDTLFQEVNKLPWSSLDNLSPIITDCVMRVHRHLIDGGELEFDLLIEHKTLVGTVFIRNNDKGGLTLMLPQDD